MTQTVRESADAWAMDIWKMAQDFANNMKKEDEPFYIVFSAKSDKNNPSKFYQAMKAYKHRPQLMLGLLVWYVDNKKGIFEFVHELSAPFDIPIDPTLLSDKASDASSRVAEKGKQLNVLFS
jgi:hypothetical protein